MSGWQSYNDFAGHTAVQGDLRLYRTLPGPGISTGENTRPVVAWLPPGHDSGGGPYPVIYMHDAQNLFDTATSYGGSTWQVEAALMALHAEGLSAIVVAVPHAQNFRAAEYSPYDFDYRGEPMQGHGDRYIAWLTDRVKPLIDQSFHTRPEATHTGIAGSSMGGLISLHALLSRPDVFGLCGAFSTAYWFGGDALLRTTERLAHGHGRVYLDVGTAEGETIISWGIAGADADAEYVAGVAALRDALLAGGYRDGHNLMYVEDPGAPHREHAWARRLPDALRFLLRA